MSNKKANRRRVTRSVTIKPHLAAWLEARQCSLSRAVEQCVELVYLEHRGDVAQLEADGHDGDAISKLRLARSGGEQIKVTQDLAKWLVETTGRGER